MKRIKNYWKNTFLYSPTRTFLVCVSL